MTAVCVNSPEIQTHSTLPYLYCRPEYLIQQIALSRALGKNWQTHRTTFDGLILMVECFAVSGSLRLVGLSPDKAFATCMSVKTTQQNVRSRPMSQVIKSLTGRCWLAVKAPLGTNLRASSIHDRQVLLVVVQQIHSLSSLPKNHPSPPRVASLTLCTTNILIMTHYP